MIGLDPRTVIASNSIIYSTCFLVTLLLWVQARGHFKGLGFWAANYAFGAIGWLLTVLSESVSGIGYLYLANIFIPVGSILLFFGLQRFTGARVSVIVKSIVLIVIVAFFSIDIYYTFITAGPVAHNINVAAFLAFTNFLCLGLIVWGTKPEIRRLAHGTILAFSIIILIELARIAGFAFLPRTNNAIIPSNFDAFMVLNLGAGVVFLTFNLLLMVNRRSLAETQQAEEKASQTVKEWQTTFDSISELVSIQDRDFNLVKVNKAYADIFNVKPEELIGKKCYEIVHAIDCPIDGCPYRETLATQKTVTRELWEPHLGLHLEVTTSPIFDSAGNVAASVHIARDVTGRRKIEAYLRENEERNLTIVRTAIDGFWMSDTQGQLLEVNESYCRMSGYSEQELLGMRIQDLEVIESSDETAAHMRRIMQQGYDRFESCHRRKDGSLIDIEISVQYLPIEGGRIVSFLRDITQRKRADEQIRTSLREKETLLKEIHHRVKNNMQVISSLLQMQSNFIKNPEDARLFEESQDRIRSMSLVYNKLYQSRDLSNISFKEYITELVENLVLSYNMSRGQINTKIDVENINLGIDTAIPCGLIINEIVVNCLKYAFKDSRNGLITISVHRSGDCMLEMKIADNGIGIPENVNANSKPTFGLALIETLVEQQLDGKLQLNRSNGTEYTIIFKAGISLEAENGAA